MKLIKKFLKYLKQRNDWVLVEILSHQIRWRDSKSNEVVDKSIIYYRLYENALGHRKCDISIAGYNKTNIDPEDREIYQTQIHAWLSGRQDRKIKTYSEAKESDMMENLVR